jgi:hypothetical protein
MGSAAGSSHWAAVLKLARRVGRPEVPGRFEEGGPVGLDASLRQPARTVRGQLIPSPACTKPTVVIRSTAGAGQRQTVVVGPAGAGKSAPVAPASAAAPGADPALRLVGSSLP